MPEINDSLLDIVSDPPARITLEHLKRILDDHFGSPFLPAGMVQARWVGTTNGDVLEVRIGRRNVWLDRAGNIVGAGVSLADADPEPATPGTP